MDDCGNHFNKDVQMKLKPLVISNKKIDNYLVLENDEGNMLGATIFKETKNGEAQIIGKTYSYPKHSSIPDSEVREMAIINSFKKIRCCICNDETQAIQMMETEIGNICIYCIAETHPSIEFKPMNDLKKYLITGKDK